MPPFDPETAAARRAQSEWQNRSVADRLKPLLAFRHALADHVDELCDAVQRDVGRPPDEVLTSDVIPLAAAAKFLEKRAADILNPVKVPSGDRPIWLFGMSDTIHRRPHGVVGIIGTWNYPLLLNGVQVLHALTAGNAVIWKPSELSSASSTLMHKLILRSGYPAELFIKLPATREGGPQLLEADIDHLIFTGSANVGRQIAKRLGERLISSTLELSGVDAMIVLPDADLNMAVNAAWFGSTVNKGQTCVAVRRAFVPRSFHPAFVAALEEKIRPAKAMPLATEGQVRQAERLVADARNQGAKVIEPDVNSDGPSQVMPRVFADAKPSMAICQEDCFAPLMAVLPYDEPDSLVELVNSCSFGLGASVFTADPAKAQTIASQIKTGFVGVNEVVLPVAHPATPFGGRGQSGWGTTQGADGLLAMTVPQDVCVRSGKFRPHYQGSDGAQGPVTQLMRGVLEMSHAPTFGRRMKGLWKVLKNAVKVK